jgi:hypothetical protein
VTETFLIFREGKEVLHPISQQKIGTIISLLGEVEIIEKAEKTSKGKITKAVGSILIGDKLKIKEEVSPGEEPTGNPALFQDGYVLALREDKLLIGSPDILYIDRGKLDGLVRGNLLSVYRVEKGMKIKLAKIEVILVQDSTSTARIIGGKAAVEVGDRVSLMKGD